MFRDPNTGILHAAVNTGNKARQRNRLRLLGLWPQSPLRGARDHTRPFGELSTSVRKPRPEARRKAHAANFHAKKATNSWLSTFQLKERPYLPYKRPRAYLHTGFIYCPSPSGSPPFSILRPGGLQSTLPPGGWRSRKRSCDMSSTTRLLQEINRSPQRMGL